MNSYVRCANMGDMQHTVCMYIPTALCQTHVHLGTCSTSNRVWAFGRHSRTQEQALIQWLA